MGLTPSGKYFEKLKRSPQHNGKTFENQVKTELAFDWDKMKPALKDYFSAKNTSPDTPLAIQYHDFSAETPDSSLFFTWFGHSAIYLEMEGKKILLDPMFGSHSSPVPIFSPRFKFSQDIPLDKIPAVDAVIYSHDHYDHLDYASVKALKDRVGHFYVPLGLGGHLQRWGVAKEKISELDWNENIMLDSLELVCTPSRHFSGRGLGNRMTTLWASWVIKGKSKKVYFSGDSGYGPHFKEIGTQHGPFDIAFVECGQYNTAWADIHMMPEQSVQAALDVKANLAMPIHWGAFSLAPHSWEDPINRFEYQAKSDSLNFINPVVGERVEVQ